MEGSYWLKVSAIVALLLGCLFVLSPTFLAEDEIEVEGGAAVRVETEPPLQMWYRTGEAAPSEEMVTAVSERLVAAGVPVDRVGTDDELLVVYLRPGARKEAISEALSGAAEPVLTVVSSENAGELDLSDAAALQGATLEVDDALALRLAAAESAEGITVSLPADASALPGGVVLDGTSVVGIVGELQPGATAVVTPVGDGPALAAAPAELPQALDRYVVEQVEEAAEEEAVVVEETWYSTMLPNTKLSLGLDLRGGIDLTLQVDLDEAVFAQVQRDRTAFQDQALSEGVDIQMKRDRSRPAIKVSSDTMSFEDMRDYMTNFGIDYAYVETIEEDGRSVHVWQVTEVREEAIHKQAVDQVLETLRKRVDSTGVKEPSIVRMSGGRINIQLPGVDNAQQAIDAIGTQAILEFRLVDEEFSQSQLDRMVAEAERTLPADQFSDDELLNEYLRSTGQVAEDRLVMWEYAEVGPDTLERSFPLMLKDRVLLTGGDLNDASVGFDQSGIPQVLMDFKPRGGQVFCDVTKENVGKRFAIILDDQIRSAPNIREAICGGSASIEMGGGDDPDKDAQTLALVLRTGSLTAPVDIGEVREIGASLGADSIRGGTIAAAIGGTLTLIFMALWYRVPGLIADFALVFNVLLVFALLALFGATLTLPGIAGVALTIGMAVDANIIVYERIREELKLGVSARKAVDVGYEKAMVAVLDANITTGIAGVVLYSYGTGPIKGFAVTLLIGIFTTIVTALFVTRTFMEMLTRNSNARLRI